MKRDLAVALVLIAALWLGWPLLALWTANQNLLMQQEKDAPTLLAAAPHALLIPQKVSGPPDKLDGRYIGRSLPQGLTGWLGRRGFGFEPRNHEGSSRSYRKDDDRFVVTLCHRFSAGFDVCTLTVRPEQP